MKTNNLDVVYPVYIKGANEELRYSLRSVAKNLAHNNVYVVGYTPENDWLSVWAHPTKSICDFVDCPKFFRVNDKLKEICKNEMISDPFILMNDDFFVMKPTDEIPYFTLGELMDRYNGYEKKGSYAVDLLETQRTLVNFGYRTQDFEAHAPMIMYKEKLLQILEEFPSSGHRRSLYGNMHHMPWVEICHDFKVYADDEGFDEDAQFISTDDESFVHHPVGKYIRSKFPEKCKYEI